MAKLWCIFGVYMLDFLHFCCQGGEMVVRCGGFMIDCGMFCRGCGGFYVFFRRLQGLFAAKMRCGNCKMQC